MRAADTGRLRLARFALVFAFWIVACVPSAATSSPCRVVGVIDGDSLTVLCGFEQFEIRLYGIDCPERGMPYNRRARQWTSQRAMGQSVEIQPMDRDRYDRMVGRVKVNGQDLSLGLVQAGLAWHYVRYAPEAEELAAAEREARSHGRGLWSLPNPVPPWKFRAARRDVPDR